MTGNQGYLCSGVFSAKKKEALFTNGRITSLDLSRNPLGEDGMLAERDRHGQTGFVPVGIVTCAGMRLPFSPMVGSGRRHLYSSEG